MKKVMFAVAAVLCATMVSCVNGDGKDGANQKDSDSIKAAQAAAAAAQADAPKCEEPKESACCGDSTNVCCGDSTDCCQK